MPAALGSARLVRDVLRSAEALQQSPPAVPFDLDVLDPARYEFIGFNNPDSPPEEYAGVAGAK